MYFPLVTDVFLDGLFSFGVGNYFIDFINSLLKAFLLRLTCFLRFQTFYLLFLFIMSMNEAAAES